MIKIMVVDDNTDIRMAVHIFLSAKGYQVIDAENGSKCLELLETQTPDLVLLDLMMPGISGWDVHAVMKNNPATKNIPVIFLTALASKEGKVAKPFEKFKTSSPAVVDVDLDNYIQKPFDLHKLLDKITETLMRKSNK
jgi:putative two-component system response regulator